MDAKEFLKLKVLERTEEMLEEVVQQESKQKFEHSRQTNPIQQKFINYTKEQAKKRFSIKDLFW